MKGKFTIVHERLKITFNNRMVREREQRKDIEGVFKGQKRGATVYKNSIILTKCLLGSRDCLHNTATDTL